MLEMLFSKLGGLIGRRVYHMPFSRQLQVNGSMAGEMLKYFTECKTGGGILLLQPENILSFQLMAIESLIKSAKILTDSLFRMQHFIESSSRDIDNESDENFSTKFELMYTMGDQRSIDHAPTRWFTIQQVLELVARFTLKIKAQFPKAVQIDNTGSGRFPRIRFLAETATESMVNMVTFEGVNDDIFSRVQQLLSTLPAMDFKTLTERQNIALRNFEELKDAEQSVCKLRY